MWQHADHVDLIDELIMELIGGGLRKKGYKGLIIEGPPRHGKSELCSHYTPAYVLGARPDWRVILASYQDTFAARWGGRVRDLLEEWGPMLYGIEVSQTSRAQNMWDIAGYRGGMFTAGAGGSITGKGANLFIIDDPIKNHADAQSEIIRQRIWDWFVSTVRTRLEPDAGILIIMTRWHEDDLVGRLREQMKDPDADQYLIVTLQAVYDPDEDDPHEDPLGRNVGQALWPDRYDEQELRRVKASVGHVVWSALYQQRPSPREGSLFQKEWFEITPFPAGKFKKMIRYWDLAATEPKKGEDPDYCVGLKLGLHEDGNFYVLDCFSMRATPDKVLGALRARATRDGRSVRVRIEQEPGSAGKIVIHTIAKALRGLATVRGHRETGSKYIRADDVSAAAERREIKIVRGEWNQEFLYWITRFPFAAHDDHVDAFSGAYNTLTSRKAAKVASW